MPSEVVKASPTAANQAEKTDGLRYVARQPIMDLLGRVYAYELLFRNGHEQSFSGDCNLASRIMLDNTMVFGLEKLTGGLTAFVNCTEEVLTSDLVAVLPPSLFVLEVLETVEPTPEVIEACRKLKAHGFRLALDDFIWKPEFEPLIKLADYIKVDFTLSGPKERRELISRLKGSSRLNGASVTLLAEKVETQEEFRQAREEGFTLIQGYYFCRPELIENRQIPSNRLSQIEILRMLREESMDLRELAGLVKRDASLTYRLLRLINSPAMGIRQRVNSVLDALVVVGEDAFRRIATLAITSELNANQPVELLRMAFVRGRFCELAAARCGLDATEQYLLGLLSLLPAMLQLPMERLAPELPLRESIRQALNGEPNPEGSLLEWVREYERGNWDSCDAVAQTHGLKQEDLVRAYGSAIEWAESALRLA
jgi:EAL and modified HD-GYP domain-containing signal transduction protein